MSKDDTSSDAETGEVSATDPDPVQLSDSSGESSDDLPAIEESPALAVPDPKPVPESGVRPRRAWFGWFNFLLILGLAGAAGYYWYLQQQVARDYANTIAELRQQLASKASSSQLDAGLEPMQAEIGGLDKKIDQLELEQKALRDSSEKLYQLYGRDKNDWQLAEVEYLMRVAQHKLVLQDDFAGAAVTLQAASDLIGLTGDPGLLPVRVGISEEIAALKTRARPDLVGMTLILAQLSRQVQTLKPGFAVRVDDAAAPEAPEGEAEQSWQNQLSAFVDSLVEVRHEASEPTEIEANIANVGETLRDNLKLARWAVLERDANQYQQLIDQSLRLFREFYDLDNAANHDFLAQLQGLQKMVLKPDKPDINGSLRELRRILSQREASPAESTATTEAASD